MRATAGATQDVEIAWRLVDGRFVPIQNYQTSNLKDLYAERDLGRP